MKLLNRTNTIAFKWSISFMFIFCINFLTVFLVNLPNVLGGLIPASGVISSAAACGIGTAVVNLTVLRYLLRSSR